MMRKMTWVNATIRFLSIVLLPIMLCNCSDEADSPVPPGDDYEGVQTVFRLGEESEGLPATAVTVLLQSATGEVFTREAEHTRSGEVSTFRMERGLADGQYRLLAVKFPVTETATAEAAADEDGTAELGLGSRIAVSEDGIRVIDIYDRQMKMAGAGSPDNPFIISSSTHLFRLMTVVNDYDGNKYVDESTCFRQVCDIDMKTVSRSCDAEYGWLPIGADTNTPFRGTYLAGGHVLKNLIIKRSKSAGIGLFGYIYNGAVDSLHMKNCTVEGQFAVGTVAGAIISGGGNVRGTGAVTGCVVEDCTVTGDATSSMVGGVLGAVDMHARGLVANCETRGGSVSGGMSVGGVFGGSGIYSFLMVSGCRNSAPVESLNSGAGGIVGTADTLQVVGAVNTGRIQGPASKPQQSAGVGSGGIVGGSGISWITSSSNSGEVSGYEGVGGIIGSTRIRGSESEAFLYNQSYLRYCTNTGRVSGKRFAGGAIGEAQAGGYSVVNTGGVSADDYAGGICGSASLAVIHNSFNSGSVSAGSHAAGIVGKCTWGSIAVCQNSGSIGGSSGIAGGVAGLVGNNTVIHYCSNFGTVDGGNGWTGGIVADVGEPRKWTGLDIAECVIGSAEIVMAFVGPTLAVVETAFEMVEAVEIGIKVVEVSADLALQAADYVLVGFSTYELIAPESEEALKAGMHACSDEVNEENVKLLASLRDKCRAASCPLFSTDRLAANHINNVNGLVDWYDAEGNDEIFNETINEKREARAEELEKVEKTKETIHTVIAGVAVATSTIAMIAGEVVTGGAATPILAVGVCAGLVGGANALIKSCTKFEKNAVIISQCVNAGALSASDSDKIGSIAGRMCDGSVMNDCLSALTDHNREEFAAEYHTQCSASHCISLAEHRSDSDGTGGKLSDCVFASKGAAVIVISSGLYAIPVSQMGSAEIYEKYNYSIGDGQRWAFAPGLAFPIPAHSEMQK